jgi:RND family efflux transporter MFP subunit
VAEAQAHVKAATAGVEAAQVRLSYVQITAPLDGYVAARLVDPGAVVAPGMPLLQVERGGNYRLEVAVPESRISAIPVGSSLAVEVEAINLHSTGRVIEIQPVLDANSRTALVRVQLPANERLRGGLFGRAYLKGARKDILLLPDNLIQQHGQMYTVFVNDGGIARRRMITVGRQSGGRSEVLSGLTAGEQVIASTLNAVSDGAPVEVGQ